MFLLPLMLENMAIMKSWIDIPELAKDPLNGSFIQQNPDHVDSNMSVW